MDKQVKTKKSSGRMYLAEYFFKHASMVWLVSSMAYAVGLIILSWFDEVLEGGSAVVGFSAFFITSILILLPLSVWLHKRTMNEEEVDPSLKDKGVRKFVLFFFLAQYAIAAIVATIVAVTATINNLLSVGAGAQFDKDFWMLVTISGVLAALFITVTVLVYKEDDRGKLSSLKIPIMIGLSSLVAILLVAFPVRMNRGAVADNQRIDDLNSIHNSIDSYVRNNNELPESLDDLDFEDRVKDRLDDYEYKRIGSQNSEYRYEICAEFNSDASFNRGYDYGGGDDSFWNHVEGRDCFNKTIYSYYDEWEPQPLPFDSSTTEIDFPEAETPEAVEFN